MIEAMPDFPEGTCGFRITGTITRTDYTETVLPRLRDLAEQGTRSGRCSSSRTRSTSSRPPRGKR